jgi:uncharacterized membrane protein
MSWTFNGLPIHVLLVHFVVIVVPLAALVAVVAAFWPAARRRIGIVSPILAFVALVSVPLATQAGEALQGQITETSLSRMHTHMGDGLLPWAGLLFLGALLQWGWFRSAAGGGALAGRATSERARLVIRILLAALVVVAAVGACVEVFLIGESGARAVWESRFH